MTFETIILGQEEIIILKISIAKILYEKKYEQSRIADILDLSQPMVSNYIKTKRKIPKKIQDISKNAAEKIINNSKIFFQTSIIFSEKPLSGQYHIATKNEIINNEKNKIIENLSEAYLKIKKIYIKNLLPKIKINIAMAIKNAETKDDIASFSDGLIISDDKIVGNHGIRFGKSQHLSQILLYLQKKIDVNAIMNIAKIENIEKTTLKHTNFTKDFKLKQTDQEIDLLIHKGDFGIEPCTYIIGKDALDVSKKFLKLTGELEQ